MGITNLGAVGISAGGAYNPETVYKKYKVVSANGGSYMYINPTPAAGVSVTDTSHWQQIASVGGQDLVDAAVAARDAAQGYKDAAAASAAQLAAGTASPVDTYANLAALVAADPDHSKIYITLDDGNWCYYNGAAFVAGGVYQATERPLDTTLSVSGMAADAKVTGDKVGELKSALNDQLDMQASTVNMLTNAVYTDGKKIDEDGQIQDTSTYEIWEIEYDGSYKEFSAVLYSGSNYLLRAMSFQDENGTALKVLEYLVTSSPYKSEFNNVSVPCGTKKIILANRNSMGPVSATYTLKYSKRLDDIEEEQAKDKKEIGTIESELEVQDYTTNLLSDATHTSGKKLNEDGEIESVSTYEIYEITYDGTYDKFNATVHSGSNYLLRAISFQDSDGEVLQVLEYSDTSSPYESVYTNLSVPEGTSKIILSNRINNGGVTATAVIKKSKRLIDIENELDSLSIFSVSSKNLFNDSKKVVGLIYEANGTMIDSYTANRSSDYIEIEASTIYTISAYHKNTGAFNIEGLRYAFYTSDKTFISGAKPEGAYSTFRTPSTAKYIRFSMLQTNNEKWQLERRSFATNYVPYNTITLNDESDEMFMNFPAKTYAVTGLEYNLYLFNVRPDKYENEFMSRYYISTITAMARYGRFLRLKSSNTSTVTRVIGAEAKSLTKYGYKLFSINVKNPENLSAVSVLILGDSTTANGYVAQNLYEFGGENHLITTLGTQGTAPYNHEGRSGWRLYDYFNTSTGNPFYNPSTQTFDAAYYFTQTGVSQPDIFIINLGINDMHYDSNTAYDARIHADGFISMMNDVITSVKGVNSSIKIAICLTTPPNTDPYSFGSTGSNIIDYDDYRISNLILCEKLIDAYDYRESEGIYLIPINACLDTKYNMPTTTEHPNSRSDLNITVPNSAANVHPNTAGYHQIADEMYAFICSLYVS